MTWQDMTLYWAWRENPEQAKERISCGEAIPKPPSVKKINYLEIPDLGMSIAMGVWDDEKYTPLNQGEIERLMNN